MKKMRNMQAWIDESEKDGTILISYKTAVVQRYKNWLLVYNYTSTTTSKQITVFLRDYCLTEKQFNFVYECLKRDRKQGFVYTIINLDLMYSVSAHTAERLHNDYDYLKLLQVVANPIL